MVKPRPHFQHNLASNECLEEGAIPNTGCFGLFSEEMCAESEFIRDVKTEKPMEFGCKRSQGKKGTVFSSADQNFLSRVAN
ncbi:hypothetical protein CEXT_426501 [Caerostris extrusa]|uniref:Uncharacterized protein n=1 Tax=Caerostris extrusa TaxID=172846 RepID=A0AAV4Y3B2_CAEEX|nr:hypothetical protein CEXT_426501 [Caerostris extrusa]